MKRLLPLLLMASCTVQNGKEITQHSDGRIHQKSYLYASLGTKAKGVQTTPEGAEILEVDDSVSLRNALTAGVSAYSAWGLLEAQKSNNAVEIVSLTQPQVTNRAGINAAVKTAGINADVQKTMIKAGMKP